MGCRGVEGTLGLKVVLVEGFKHFWVFVTQRGCRSFGVLLAPRTPKQFEMILL